jgi:hypothetical protein
VHDGLHEQDGDSAVSEQVAGAPLDRIQTGEGVAHARHRLLSHVPSRLGAVEPGCRAQAQVRARVADNLQAVVSLRLLPNKKGTDRVPAVEIMKTTRSIQECIKDQAKTSEMNDYIAKARSENMQTFDQHLLDLLRANKISVETAFSAASNPTDFKTKLALEGGDPDSSTPEEKILGPMELESDERF